MQPNRIRADEADRDSRTRTTTQTPELRVGCSGWQYRHWRGNFYPDELAQSRWFSHGTKKYGGRYYEARLGSWAEWLAVRHTDGMDVFAYFNHDTGGHAPRDAVRLRQALDERLGTGTPVRRTS